VTDKPFVYEGERGLIFTQEGGFAAYGIVDDSSGQPFRISVPPFSMNEDIDVLQKAREHFGATGDDVELGRFRVTIEKLP
jgi:hypothetical protein